MLRSLGWPWTLVILTQLLGARIAGSSCTPAGSGGDGKFRCYCLSSECKPLTQCCSSSLSLRSITVLRTQQVRSTSLRPQLTETNDVTVGTGRYSWRSKSTTFSSLCGRREGEAKIRFSYLVLPLYKMQTWKNGQWSQLYELSDPKGKHKSLLTFYPLSQCVFSP